ncbi:hypothetical protein [Paenisporosarcina sp. NPDC076898]|uniref:hypothetical protein n=1 Tax=unclassified Paenisporosarcina TaxID=2642018 RepID=UPI003D070806
MATIRSIVATFPDIVATFIMIVATFLDIVATFLFAGNSPHKKDLKRSPAIQVFFPLNDSSF